MADKKLTYNGFRTMGVWLGEFIKELWASEQQSLQNQLYPVVGMMYLFHETNVQAISQYGQEGRTYYFGDSRTEDVPMQVPANALYYTEGESKVFVTTEDGEYIVTQPNDKGEMFTAEYHNDITYLA